MAPFLPCPSPSQPASELADGQHTLQVRAIDEAGNIDPTPAAATFTVKRPPPPVPSPFGINFDALSWTFADVVDSLGGASTDIESVRVVSTRGWRKRSAGWSKQRRERSTDLAPSSCVRDAA